MYETVQLDELRLMAKWADETPELRDTFQTIRKGEHYFTMNYWLKRHLDDGVPCGTSGCLIGTYRIRKRAEWDVGTAIGAGQGLKLLGLGNCVGNFLFSRHRDIALEGRFQGYLLRRRSRDAVDLSKDEAIARLRKYIRYVERKRALWEDYDWWMSFPKRLRRESDTPERAKRVFAI